MVNPRSEYSPIKIAELEKGESREEETIEEQIQKFFSKIINWLITKQDE